MKTAIRLLTSLLIIVVAFRTSGSDHSSNSESLVGKWKSKGGETLTFGRLDSDGEGNVTGCGKAVRYRIRWKEGEKRAFDLDLEYTDDPGLPPTYKGRLSEDGQTLTLLATPNQHLADSEDRKPTTTVYKKQKAKAREIGPTTARSANSDRSI